MARQRAAERVMGGPAHAVIIHGAQDAASGSRYLTLVADGIDVPTTVRNLIVEGADASGWDSGGARSSFAIRVTDSTGLVLEDVRIVAGRGADGEPGVNGTSASTTPATSGGTGGSAAEYATTCDDSSRGSGGSGAGSGNRMGGAGGAGGTMDTYCDVFPPSCNYSATPGLAGGHALSWGTGYGRGGAGALANSNADGDPGEAGRTVHGTGGSGGLRGGAVSAGWWAPFVGGAGSIGEDGTGGGWCTANSHHPGGGGLTERTASP